MRRESGTDGRMVNRPIGSSGGRSSNFELLRIVAMMAIVAHHYVVNSTVMQLGNPFHPTANYIFLQLWGMWGKTAINAFVLITGYFMCVKRLTARRFCKMLFAVLFYSWVMWIALCCAGYETFSPTGVWHRVIGYWLLVGQNKDFVPAFLWMYLTVPFMNVYIKAASRRNLYAFIGVLLLMFSVCSTVFDARLYHYVFWYMTLYLVGAAIRLHPFRWMGQNRVCCPALFVSVALGWASVLCVDRVLMWAGWPIMDAYYFLSDSNKLLAFAVAFFAFLVFKNLKLPQSRFINAVASTTFGVLLIHAASDGMRKWLWQDFVNVPRAYSFSLPALCLYSIAVMMAVFTVCSVLDTLRIRFLERPLFDRWPEHNEPLQFRTDHGLSGRNP